MGCDIHSRAEVFNDKTGEWEMLGDVFDDPYYDPENEYYKKRGGRSEEPYGMRNYNLFAFLADVRNGYDLVPMAAPRGVPEDASQAYKDYVEQWGIDGHSHSYFTLKELQDASNSQTVHLEGCVTAEEYKRLKEEGEPSTWSGGIFGATIFRISNQEMEEYLADPEYFSEIKLGILLEERLREWSEGHMNGTPAYQGLLEIIERYKKGEDIKPSYYTVAHWDKPLTDCLGKWWYENTLPRLQELAPNGDPTKIRMVFFFDN